LRAALERVIVSFALSAFRYRLIDTAGSEIEIVSDERASIGEGDVVTLPDGTAAEVVEVYDDEHGQEGEVVATLVLDLD
jgi:methylaspartate ammonia-lyase